MSFLVTIAGTVANSTIKTNGGAPANVPHWPRNGASFKGSFIYAPAATPTPALFAKIFVDFGSFSITRHNGVGNISLVNGGAGIQYADGDSTGFNNVSLPAAGWQLQELDMLFANPTGLGAASPAALDFDLFTQRTLLAKGNNGATPNALVWSVLTRIDVAVVLPA